MLCENPNHSNKRKQETGYCMACYAAGARKNPEQNLRFKKHLRNSYLKRTYKLTAQDYEEMLAGQGGVCGICKRSSEADKRLVVDHDHKTGAIRGLLCDNCNWLLGHASDDLEILAAAICYLSGQRN